MALLVLIGMGTSVQAVVLPQKVARQLEQRFDAFINADGYTERDLSSFPDADWYTSARFPYLDSGQSGVMLLDNTLESVPRMVLFVNGHEKKLSRVRYRISYRLSAAPGDYADVRHAYIEITRFNLGPKMHRQLQETANGNYPVAPKKTFGIGPHVSWRFVTTPIQGLQAAIVRASRRQVSEAEARAADCLGEPCLSLIDPKGPDGNWQTPTPPELDPPVYSDSDGSMPGPTRIAQYLFAYATRHGQDPTFGNFADKPQMIFVISKDIEGQDRTINGLLHEPHVMDHEISEFWTRRLQVTPDVIEWRTLAIPWPDRSQASQSQAPRLADDAADGVDTASSELPQPQAAASDRPRFEDYPAMVYAGPPPDEYISSKRIASKNAVLRRQADFAGEYVIHTWGCGTGCGMTGFVSKRDGRELERTFNTSYRGFPIQGTYVVRADDGSIKDRLAIGSYANFLVDGEKVRAHQADSRLLVTTQAEMADYGTFRFRYFHNYYVLEQGKLRLIRQTEVAQPYRDDAIVDFGANAQGLVAMRADDVPLFGDYPAPAVYSGPPGELQLDVHGDLRARIVQQLAEPPVFAGAYTIVEQRCPASAYCKLQFLVNRRTGQAVPTFFKADATGNGDGKHAVGEWVRTAAVDSCLLITQEVTPGGSGQSARHFNNYYLLRDGNLQLLKQVELPNPFGK